MSCVLGAIGVNFEVEAFLAGSPFKPQAVLKGGEKAGSGPSSQRGPRLPGFTLTVSEAGADDLAAQIDEAIEFLDKFEDELRRLASFHGVDAVMLDFGVQRREVALQTETFPPELLWRCGALDIALAVSHYASEPTS